MRDEEDDPDADIGIQAFQEMGQAMDRLGDALKTSDRQHEARVNSQEAATLRIRDVTAKANQAAEVALKASQTALQAAKTEIRSSLLWTGGMGLLVALLAVLVGYFIGHSSGWDAGEASGYASARNQVAAAAWANTPNGQRALVIDQLGSLNMLTVCSAPGWNIQHQDGHRVCFPGNDPQGRATGWFIP